MNMDRRPRAGRGLAASYASLVGLASRPGAAAKAVQMRAPAPTRKAARNRPVKAPTAAQAEAPRATRPRKERSFGELCASAGFDISPILNRMEAIALAGRMARAAAQARGELARPPSKAQAEVQALAARMRAAYRQASGGADGQR